MWMSVPRALYFASHPLYCTVLKTSTCYLCGFAAQEKAYQQLEEQMAKEERRMQQD
jgi:hypothetical protein